MICFAFKDWKAQSHLGVISGSVMEIEAARAVENTVYVEGPETFGTLYFEGFPGFAELFFYATGDSSTMCCSNDMVKRV